MIEYSQALLKGLLRKLEINYISQKKQLGEERL